MIYSAVFLFAACYFYRKISSFKIKKTGFNFKYRPFSLDREYISINDDKYSLFRNHHTLEAFHIENSVLSLLSGSVAGAIGFGVAYPFDAIKTKAQIYINKNKKAETDINTTTTTSSLGLVKMIKLIAREEGIGGFYGGVRVYISIV